MLDFLKEQGSSEEYQEALDLIFRLVKSKDKVAAKKNADIILEETGNVELLLDLLEHEDPIIGVTTSQILTEIHAVDGASLEAQIQMCPDGNDAFFISHEIHGQLINLFSLGMNKLLQRLPDSSREEVRDQAIVLIQQLTSSNEEMKKTVVFNEVRGA